MFLKTAYWKLILNTICFFSELELLVPHDFGGEVGRGETESLGDGAVHPWDDGTRRNTRSHLKRICKILHRPGWVVILDFKKKICCEILILWWHFTNCRVISIFTTFQFCDDISICLRESYFVECHRWSMNTEYQQKSLGDGAVHPWDDGTRRNTRSHLKKLKKNLIKKKL